LETPGDCAAASVFWADILVVSNRSDAAVVEIIMEVLVMPAS
jgi:hypothetical protein